MKQGTNPQMILMYKTKIENYNNLGQLILHKKNA